MKQQTTEAVSFGVADYGICWAVRQLPQGKVDRNRYYVGDKTLELGSFPAGKGGDDYAVQRHRTGFRVLANSAVGSIAGIQCLGSMLRDGKVQNRTVTLRLRTRNYKHEATFFSKHPQWVGHYSDAMWETLCQRLVSLQFNGLVIYAGYHPFEFFLDYKEWPLPANQTEVERTATREAVHRGLAIAHRYGLKTFLHHYVGHFTKELAETHGISTSGRYSWTEHPVVEQYCRFCYREVFRQLPDLDGLYFNFESYSNAHEHVLATAIPELNAMRRHPIMVFRLWCYTNYEGMASMLRAYRGRVIIGHKIIDTNDAYYLPVADSRVMEWKKRLGKQIEWMFLVGPCHNCGTNHCNQLWADYDFVQKLLANAQKKGADSISFHSAVELFCADLPAAQGLFSEHERNLSRFNRLHVLAVSDYVNKVTRSSAECAQVMAALNSVTPVAGRHLFEAIHSSSQLILLVYQQFYMTSHYDGYLNRGRYSTIQDPFYYPPVTELNHQSRKALFTSRRGWAWVPKTIDTNVVPDGAYQHIIDYVDPTHARRRAPRNPKVIAQQLLQNARKSHRSLAAYRHAAGDVAAAKLAPYIEQNAVTGEYIRHEILAGVNLYSLYFPKSRASVAGAIRKGLKELQSAAALIPDRTSAAYKQLKRSTMLNIEPENEIALAEKLLNNCTSSQVPMRLFASYVESHRRFNEIRRKIKPRQQFSRAQLCDVRQSLNGAIHAADETLMLLDDGAFRTCRANVQRWRDYLSKLHRETYLPRVICDERHGTPILPLHHEDCFRDGEDFLEDFVSFFRPVDFARLVRLSAQISRTRTELVVRLHEDGVGLKSRRLLWQKHHGEGSDSYVMRVFVDVSGRGLQSDMYIVWPVGGGVSRGPQLNLPVTMEQQDHDDSWDMIVRFPFRVLGRTPRKGETWGINVFSNPFVTRNTCYVWASQYDSNNSDRYGKITFG